MAKILRVHELAKELGMSNQETLDLCGKMGIGVKTQSSTIIDQQADRVRTKAQREGLVRDVQPEEPKPVKKAVKKAAAKKSDDGTEEKAPVKKAAAKKAFGSDSLEGKSVSVQGTGHVGVFLLEYLAKENVKLFVSDFNAV